MEAGVKSDQGYESFDSLSACGSERKSSLSDAEFDPISDDDEDDYSKPGLEDSVIDGLSEQLRDGATLLSRAPMKNIDNVRDMRRESAHPWSIQTQNCVTPSGGRVIRSVDTNTNYMLQNFERVYNGQQRQNVLTSNLQTQNVFTNSLQAKNVFTNNLQAQNVLTNNLQAQNVLTNNLQRQNVLTNNLQAKSVLTNNLQAQNILTSNLQTQSTMTGTVQSQNHAVQPQSITTNVDQRNDFNITGKNNSVTGTNFISMHLTNNNLAGNNFLGKNQTNSDIYSGTGVDKSLPSYEVANKHLPSHVPVNIYIQPPSVSSDELTDELQDLSEYPELQEFARFRAEEENSSGTDYTEYIRHLFTDTLPELSAADVNEGFGQLDKNDFGKISPLSFSSTIVPPSVDSFPSSPTDCDLLAALTDQDVLGAALNAAPGSNVAVVPDFISILRTGESSAKQTAATANTNYTSLVTSASEYSTYTSSTNSFLDIRGQRGSFSTSSTPSHPGSVEYSPQSSADSQPSPHGSDVELYQQFSPNIIPVTVNDDLGEDDGSRLDNTTAKERLLQRIRADPALKKAKDTAWLAASKTEPEKLKIAIQDLCRSVDHTVEAKFYANMEVFMDNATQAQIVQLFESVRFQRCANVVNNPLLNAYVCEIMLDRGVE
ncbi:hypothetical protein CBL_02124 [Carabus blaptoides fortunei]